jgi:hypothetical protein
LIVADIRAAKGQSAAHIRVMEKTTVLALVIAIIVLAAVYLLTGDASRSSRVFTRNLHKPAPKIFKAVRRFK